MQPNLNEIDSLINQQSLTFLSFHKSFLGGTNKLPTNKPTEIATAIITALNAAWTPFMVSFVYMADNELKPMLPGTNKIMPGICITDAGLEVILEYTLPAIETSMTATRDLKGCCIHKPIKLEPANAKPIERKIQNVSANLALNNTENDKAVTIKAK